MDFDLNLPLLTRAGGFVPSFKNISNKIMESDDLIMLESNTKQLVNLINQYRDFIYSTPEITNSYREEILNLIAILQAKLGDFDIQFGTAKVKRMVDNIRIYIEQIAGLLGLNLDVEVTMDTEEDLAYAVELHEQQLAELTDEQRDHLIRLGQIEYNRTTQAPQNAIQERDRDDLIAAIGNLNLKIQQEQNTIEHLQHDLDQYRVEDYADYYPDDYEYNEEDFL